MVSLAGLWSKDEYGNKSTAGHLAVRYYADCTSSAKKQELVLGDTVCFQTYWRSAAVHLNRSLGD